MKMHIHKSEERGGADFGWLKTKHSFSFGDYYNPKRMNFGTLRVLNDDIIAPGRGFDPHPHREMEIITIPLSGKVKHDDSSGGSGVIGSDEIQRMSAGTGIVHSEANASQSEELRLLQIWITPKEKKVAPNYEQKKFDESKMENKFLEVVAPQKSNAVFINQDAHFYLAKFTARKKISFVPKLKGGVFVFVIEGSVKIENKVLEERDSAELEGCSRIDFEAKKGAKVLVIEITFEK